MSDIGSIGGAVGPPGPPGATGPGGPGISPIVNGYQNFMQELAGIGGPFPVTNGGDSTDAMAVEFDPLEGIDAERVAWSSGLDGGTSALNFLRLTPSAGDTKALAVQWFNEEDSYAFKGSGVNAGVQFRIGDGTPGTAMRMLLLGSTGPSNGITRPMVTSFNGAGVDPTFDASITNLGGVTLAQGGLFVFQTGLMTISAPFDDATKNLGIALVSDDVLRGGLDQMDISALAVNPSSAVTYPNKLQDAIDYLATQERIEKSYEADTLPGTITSVSAAGFTGGGLASIRYHSRKSFDPLTSPGGNPGNGITLYSPVTGAAGFWHDLTAGADFAVAPINSGENGFDVSLAAVPAGNEVIGHWVSNASL